jgi:hypothetical protein
MPCKLQRVESFPSLQKLFTPQQSGTMTPLWNANNEEPFEVKYIYEGTLYPRTTKGPYKHTIRSGHLFFLSGEALIVHRPHGLNKYCEDYLVPRTRIALPVNEEYCLIGLGNTESIFINICNYAWLPGDRETVVPDFSTYNFAQWGIR